MIHRTGSNRSLWLHSIKKKKSVKALEKRKLLEKLGKPSIYIPASQFNAGFKVIGTDKRIWKVKKINDGKYLWTLCNK